MTRKSTARRARDKRGALPQSKPQPVHVFTPRHKFLCLAVLAVLGGNRER